MTRTGITYSTDQMVEATGATGRQLMYWAGKGWLSSVARGSGYQRQWTERDKKIARMIVRCMLAGFNLQNAVDITRMVINKEITDDKVQVKLSEGVWLIVQRD